MLLAARGDRVLQAFFYQKCYLKESFSVLFMIPVISICNFVDRNSRLI